MVRLRWLRVVRGANYAISPIPYHRGKAQSRRRVFFFSFLKPYNEPRRRCGEPPPPPTPSRHHVPDPPASPYPAPPHGSCLPPPRLGGRPALLQQRRGVAGPAAGRRGPRGTGVSVVGLRELPHPQRRQHLPRRAAARGRPARRRHPRAPLHHRLRRRAPARALLAGGARRHWSFHLPRPTQLRNHPTAPSPPFGSAVISADTFFFSRNPLPFVQA
jgi:hypothetical protein